MNKLKIYLDTSVISFYYAEDAPEFRKITIDFFKNFSTDYDIFISEVVIFEISKIENEMDILLSWNFKHLANIKKQILVNSVNEREGFLKKLNLLSPLEVQNED
jgi:predicted nucleic-acid-binding protein